MAYQIQIEREAAKTLKGLSGKLKSGIVKKMNSLASDPRPVGCEPIEGTDDP